MDDKNRLIKIGLASAAGAYLTWKFANLVKYQLHRNHLHKQISMRRDERDKSIEIVKRQFAKTSRKVRDEIQQMEFTELMGALQQGLVTCVDVLHAYQELACKAHEITNCVTQFVVEAEEWAQEWDKAPLSARGKLHGLPFSVKEELAMKGYDSTWGFAQRIGDTMQEDAIVIKTLKELGAIPFVRTNVPQCLLSGNCSNPVYGTSCNKYNKDRSPGGSSGGEGAILSCKGSAFGVGSDVGGSVRIPAHFSGVVSLKPTVERMTQNNTISEVSDFALVESTYALMATTAEALEALHSIVFGTTLNANDAYAVPLPWKSIQEVPKLRIGWYDTSDALDTAPGCQRAVRMTVAALKSCGHEMVQWQMPRLLEVTANVFSCLLLDTGSHLQEALVNDIKEPHEMFQYRIFGTSKNILIPWMLLRHGRRLANFYGFLCNSPSELRHLYKTINQYRFEVEQLWREAGIDAVISPVNSSVSMPHGLIPGTAGSYSYTCVYNLLDYPAGVARCTTVEQIDIDQAAKKDWAKGDIWDQNMHKANADSSCLGLPIGVQVASLPYKDELVVALMRQIEKLLIK